MVGDPPSLCQKGVFSDGTSRQKWVRHLKTEHKLENVSKRGPTKKRQKTASIVSFFPANSEEDTKRKIAMSFVMTGDPFDRVRNSYWLNAFGSTLPRGFKNPENVKKEVSLLAADVRKAYLGAIKNKTVALEMDGGKDIAGNKLVCSTVMVDHCTFLHDLHDTQLQTLDTAWHKSYIVKTVRALDSSGAFVPSITIDNEEPHTTLKRSS